MCPEVRAGRETPNAGLCRRPSRRCALHPRRGGEKRSVGGSTWVETCRPPSFLLVVEIAHGLPERLLISRSNLDWLRVGFPWGKSGRKVGRIAAQKGASEALGELETDPRVCERRGGARSSLLPRGPRLLLLLPEATAEGCAFSPEPDYLLPEACCDLWSYSE